MTADGRFIDDGRFGSPFGRGGFGGPARLSWPMRVGLAAVAVAFAATAIAGAAIALYVASLLLPVALLAGLVAYVAFRVQLWRARRARYSGLRRASHP